MKLCECGCGKQVSKVGNRFIHGHHWNGKKHSEETRKKMSKNHIGLLVGKKLSEEHKRKLSESHKGKKHSEETIKKLSESHKDIKHSKESIKKMSEIHIGLQSGENHPLYGKKHSKETKKKMSESKTGINNYNWQGGISFEPYCPKFNKELKEKIRDKYNRKCFNCGKLEKDNITKTGKIRKLDIHHVDLDKEQGCNDKEWKLIPLCMNCHRKLHKKHSNRIKL